MDLGTKCLINIREGSKYMTFYVYIIDNYFNPYSGAYMTLPGYSPEEVEDVLKDEGILDESIVLTNTEAKKFLNALKNSDAETSSEYLEIYDSMKDDFVFEKYLSEGTSNISYSFWITGAYDGHTSFYAVGADTVGAYEFNLNSIAKKLGEKYFYNYVPLKGKRVQHFSSLLNMLRDNNINANNLTEEKLISACQENKYFIFQK